MAEEIKLKMDVTAREAAVIRFIRDASPFSDINIIKRNDAIERMVKEESHTIKDIEKKYGIAIESNGSAIAQLVKRAIIE